MLFKTLSAMAICLVSKLSRRLRAGASVPLAGGKAAHCVETGRFPEASSHFTVIGELTLGT